MNRDEEEEQLLIARMKALSILPKVDEIFIRMFETGDVGPFPELNLELIVDADNEIAYMHDKIMEIRDRVMAGYPTGSFRYHVITKQMDKVMHFGGLGSRATGPLSPVDQASATRRNNERIKYGNENFEVPRVYEDLAKAEKRYHAQILDILQDLLDIRDLVILYQKINLLYHHYRGPSAAETGPKRKRRGTRKRFRVLDRYYTIANHAYFILHSEAQAMFADKIGLGVGRSYTFGCFDPTAGANKKKLTDKFDDAATLARAVILCNIRDSIIECRDPNMPLLKASVDNLTLADVCSVYIDCWDSIMNSERTHLDDATRLVNEVYHDVYEAGNDGVLHRGNANTHAKLCLYSYVYPDYRIMKNDLRVKCEEWIMEKSKHITDLPPPDSIVEEAFQSEVMLHATNHKHETYTINRTASDKRPLRKRVVELRKKLVGYSDEFKNEIYPMYEILREMSEDYARIEEKLEDPRKRAASEISRCLRCKKPARIQAQAFES